MWERSRNNLAPAFPAAYGIFTSLAILLVIPHLLFVYTEFSEDSGFSYSFFLGGALLEGIIAMLLLLLFRHHRIRRIDFIRIDRMLRTVFGLPLTIYLALEAPYGYMAYLRFLPVLVSISFLRGIRGGITHLSFFIAGLFIFSFFKTGRLFDSSHMQMIVYFSLNSVLVILGILYGKEKMISLRRKFRNPNVIN